MRILACKDGSALYGVPKVMKPEDLIELWNAFRKLIYFCFRVSYETIFKKNIKVCFLLPSRFLDDFSGAEVVY